ncbi:MAG: hypothetical protein ACE5L7_02370 [Candidatus Aminicenantales bacterium]
MRKPQGRLNQHGSSLNERRTELEQEPISSQGRPASDEPPALTLFDLASSYFFYQEKLMLPG